MPFDESNQTGSQLVDAVRERLSGLLDAVPSVEFKVSQPEPAGAADLSLDVEVGREPWRLIVEVKRNGEPRMIRGVVQQLQQFQTAVQDLRPAGIDARNTYPIAAAPYIGLLSQEICERAGIGFLDLAGNCRLAFDGVFIERRGFRNPRAEQRPLRTLFAPKASRVLRVLFEEPGTPWKVQTLARTARVSLGLASKVKSALLDLQYATDTGTGVRLTEPEKLLRLWVLSYSYRKNPAYDYYAGADEPRRLEKGLVNYCRSRGIPYALSLFSGAARVAPFTRYPRSFAYLGTDAPELAQDLGWKRVPSGANFTLMRPVDEGLLYGAREVQGETIVSDLQLYLDLASYKGRGEEAASFVLEQRLRPRW